MTNNLLTIKAQQGWGAGYIGTGRGPRVLGEWGYFDKLQTQYDIAMDITTVEPERPNPIDDLNMALVYPEVLSFNQRLEEIISSHEEHAFPFIVGGEHSIAMGTWSGIVRAHDAHEQFGLLWIDAHMDAHRPITSLTSGSKWGGHLHGTPLAHLLGHGDRHLCELGDQKTKLHFDHVALIGVRSYEEYEKEFLDRFGVRYYEMEEIHDRGLDICLKEAIILTSSAPKGWGISFDCDSLDPKDAPGVGTPEDGGLRIDGLVQSMASIEQKHFDTLKGLEVVEYNAIKDEGFKTAESLLQFTQSVFDRLFTSKA